MKYIFTFLSWMTILTAQGQTITIPDANFKAALIGLGIDINNDGQIQQTEADLVTDLELPLVNQDTIRDLTGIRSFSNLATLVCNEQKIRDVDVSGLSRLQQISFPYMVNTINVSNCANIDSLSFWELDSVHMINAANCPRLKTLNLEMALHLLQISLINLENCDSLVEVKPGYATVYVLNISGSDRIRSLTNFRTVLELQARNCVSLTQISEYPGHGSFSKIDVTGCVNLESVSIGESMYVADIDLSTCPNIKTLLVNAAVINDHCLSINLKNGTRMENCRISLVSSGNGLPTCINICADDFELDSVSNWLHFVNGYGAELSSINSFCSFTPAASYNSITGKARLSSGSTCSNTDRAMPNIPIMINDTAGHTFLKYTEPTGDYRHFFYTGEYNIRPYFPYPYFNINPTTATVHFDTANSLVETRDFCIVPTGVHNDLDITFLPSWPVARPGFDARYTLTYKNQGTTTLSGNVSVNFDNNKMNFVSASENVTTQSSGQLQWSYNNLQPFESKTISVSFNLLPPPVNNIDDTISYLAVITPSDNDETAFDNVFVLPQRVVGSFDPNDKQCIEGSKLDISKIGNYLHYMIRFQNEGTDTAFNIVVADTLSDKLDWSSFEFIGSSHPCNPELKNNKAAFYFQNIHLPYKAINEPASNGWVSFKIKPKPAVVIGDSLNNTAAIYFDFNMPVITNRATTIVTSAASPVPVKLEYFSVNQKNNTNILNWKVNSTDDHNSFVIERSDDGIHFKAIGNMNATARRCQLPFYFTDNDPVAGKNFYRLQISGGDGKSFYSKTLVVGNNKAGIAITAVVNNTIYFHSNKQQAIQMKVIAADGKELLQKSQTVSTGSNHINLPVKNISKGIYSLIIYTADGAIISRRFLY